MRTNKTTKLLALTLSLLMLFTMIPLSVSAQGETGTILDTTIEGIETDGNGNYYLTGDVTVTATYADEFTGTFDGKGYTVTTSVPLFNKVNGATIKNLSVEGTVTGYAAVANCVTGENKTVFENVTNKAAVTNESANISTAVFGFYSAYVPASGIVCIVHNTTADFVGCVNEGTIKSNNAAAGIASYVCYSSVVSLYNCKNNGEITATENHAGGIIAFILKSTATVDNCENTKAVKGAMYVGGIVGGLTDNWNNRGSLSAIACKNAGEITATNTSAGGIVGYLKNKDENYNISYCYNTAKVTASGTGECGGIVGCLYDVITKVVGCYNSGTVEGTQAAQIYMAASATDNRYGDLNFYLSDDSDSVLLPYLFSSSGYKGNSTPYIVNDSVNDLTSGKLALDMNTAIGKTVYYQNINEDGATNDDRPVLDPTHGYVFENGGKLYSLVFYTLKTASVRISDNPAERGIRFATAVNKADYDVLTAAKISLEFATRIAPDDYLQDANNDFTDLVVDETCVDVKSSETGDKVFKVLNGENNTDYYYFCGSITNIKKANYDWDYSAIGYVKIGDVTVYSGQYATRNIKYVANAAYNDTTAAYSEKDRTTIYNSYIKEGE